MEGTKTSRGDARVVEALDMVMPFVGILTVLAAVLVVEGRWPSAGVALVGLILVEAGVWRVSSRILHARHYNALRAEVRWFLERVRDLNHAAVAAKEGDAEARDDLQETVAAMHASVDRMLERAAEKG